MEKKVEEEDEPPPLPRLPSQDLRLGQTKREVPRPGPRPTGGRCPGMRHQEVAAAVKLEAALVLEDARPRCRSEVDGLFLAEHTF